LLDSADTAQGWGRGESQSSWAEPCIVCSIRTTQTKWYFLRQVNLQMSQPGNGGPAALPPPRHTNRDATLPFPHCNCPGGYNAAAARHIGRCHTLATHLLFVQPPPPPALTSPPLRPPPPLAPPPPRAAATHLQWSRAGSWHVQPVP
jgi:hypothetical protein